MSPENKSRSEPQLLRIAFQSQAVEEEREFLLYLPRGYADDTSRHWPVILFLHGGGERGNGRDDLDYVLHHGPLGEAWIYHRDLPFVMIGPQLPLFDVGFQTQLRADVPKPKRVPQPPATRPVDRPQRQMLRAANPAPAALGVTEAWGDEGFPGGWQNCEDDLIAILDHVLAHYNTDNQRVYLTGMSYGGNGTWHMAAKYPQRWAAVAPICGDSNPEGLGDLARENVPIWMFHGGRDEVIKPEWAYDLANALERAGHPSVRFTVHEDLGHDCWTRVYGGQDIYHWFLAHSCSR
jgi:predicted peptidase